MSGKRQPVGFRLLRFPWWVSVLAAIVCYCTLKYLIPLLQPSSPALAGMVRAAPALAPLVTIPLLLLAAKQLYDTDEPSGEEGDGDEE